MSIKDLIDIHEDLKNSIIRLHALHNLDNAIYDVREREGEGWDGPQVTEYREVVGHIFDICGIKNC